MAETKTEEAIGDVLQLTDGQIALSARNEGDGTWSVRVGPGGPVVEDGLAYEEAVAIVGAPTGPYTPGNRAEVVAAARRRKAEEAARKHVNAEAMKSDVDLGLVDEDGVPTFEDEPEPVRLGAAAKRGSASAAKAPSAPKNGGE